MARRLSFRGQSALESLVVLAGLFAFAAAVWVASQPLQDAAFLQVDRLDQQAAFERLRFAVALASVSAPGFFVSDSFHIGRNASLAWTDDALAWVGPAFNATLDASFATPGRFALTAGRHGFAVRRTKAVVLEVD